MRRDLFQPLAGASGLSSLHQPIAAANSFLPSDLSGLQLWLESSPRVGYLFTDVGGTAQAVTTNDVAHWKDHSSNARNLTEATAKPIVTDYGVNYHATLDFTAANADRLSAASAADWKFLHDGTGCTALVVYKGNDENLGFLLDTGGVKAAAVGMSLWHDDGPEGRLQLSIRNGAAQIFNLGSPNLANAYPAAQFHIAEYTYIEGASPEVNIYGDGCLHLSGNTSAAPSAANPAAALRVGLDIDATAAFALGGSMAAVVLYNRVLSAGERRQVENYLSMRYAVPVGNVACLGDSILAGASAAITRIPATVLANRLGPLWRATNFAVSGSFIDATGVDVNDAQWLHATAGARRRGYNFICVLAGVNDLAADTSAASCYTQLQTIYNSVLADSGNRLIVCTLLPFKTSSFYTAGREAERITLNNSIRSFAAANANTHLVDLAAVMADPADAEVMWAPYVLDYLHPNQAGSDAMAAAIADKLLAIGLG